jgi:hypothetical protein
MKDNNWRLSDEFALQGEWWLPEEPNQRIRGELKFSPFHPISLRLDGVLGPSLLRGGSRPFRVPIILGKLEDEKSVTLESIWEHRGTVKATYEAETLYYGWQFSTPEGAKFNRAYIELTDIREWIMLEAPWNSYRNSEEDVVRLRPQDLGLSELLAFPVEAIGGRISILRFTTMRGGMWTCNFETFPIISIYPDAPEHFHYYLKVTRRLVQLFTLLIGAPIYIERVRGVAVSEEQDEAPPYRRDPPLIYFRHGYIGGAPEILEDVFRFRQVRHLFGQLLNGWFGNADLLGIVYDLATDVVYSKSSALEARFLTVCQALEGFHRATRREQDKYIESTEFEKIVRHIYCAIPNDTPLPLRDRITSVLQGANEYPLRKKVKALLDSLTPEARDLITHKPGRFNKQIADTRNSLTHNDPASFGEHVVPQRDLWFLLNNAHALLVILLLQKANMPLDLIIQCMNDTAFFKMWLEEGKQRLS